jgi:hypothetical protein
MTQIGPKMTQRERREAVGVVMAEASREISEARALEWLDGVEAAARTLHRVYVRRCNGYSGRDYAYPEQIRARDNRMADRELDYLRQVFGELGLGLYLNGDPRGNPVGILTPKTGKFNTWGGAEAGWRL